MVENEDLKYICKFCNYICSKKSDYIKHLNTNKHHNLIDDKCRFFVCHCGKRYSHRQSLHKHKKKCNSFNDKLDQILRQNEILLKENEEIKSKLDNCPNVQINQSFNLHVYLNEECKDAINLKDFISGMQIDCSDLDSVQREGINSSVTNIFLKNLEEIENSKRPIQCSDVKREVVYVKDENIWQKDDESRKIKNSIMEIKDKHMKNISKWKSAQMNEKCYKDDLYLDLIKKLTNDVKLNNISREIMKFTKINK